MAEFPNCAINKDIASFLGPEAMSLQADVPLFTN